MTERDHAGTCVEHATDIKDILRRIEKENTRCRELTRMGDSEQAEQSLASARESYSDLIAAADLENPVHRSIIRNRRADLGTMAAEVESCRLKNETEKTRQEKKRAHKTRSTR